MGREMKEGEAGLVVYFHYKVAKKAYDFNPLMEKEFLEIMCEYFNDEQNKYWVIEEDGEILGSLGVDKINEKEPFFPEKTCNYSFTMYSIRNVVVCATPEWGSMFAYAVCLKLYQDRGLFSSSGIRCRSRRAGSFRFRMHLSSFDILRRKTVLRRKSLSERSAGQSSSCPCREP